MNFCRRCGKSLKNTEGHVYRCEQGHILFANCTPSTGVFFLTADNQVILSERAIEPHKGMLDAFGGFVAGEQTLEAATVRELEEETLLKPGDYGPLQFLCSGIGHYPYGGEAIPVIVAFYWSHLRPGKMPQPTDEIAAIHTVPLDTIDLATLHDDDIRVGMRALQEVFLK